MKKLTVFSLLILLIIYRFFTTRPVFDNGDIIKISTTVTSEPIIYDDSICLKLYGLKIYLPKFSDVSYGDRVVITGEVNKEKQRLDGPTLISVNQNKNKLYGLREKIISFYKKNLPEPHSSLVAGMVLGSKQMPAVFWEKLKNTGTAHVVVASGTNVTFVAAFLMGVCTYFMKRRRAIAITLVGIGVYVILSGFDAPIVRAAIMGAVAFSAQALGRLASAWKALFYSVFLMLLFKPDWIVDLGFILSVLATSGLMLFQKGIDSKLKFVPNILREGLTTSLAAQIFVAPVIFVTFGQFNILSPLINALILWTTPYIMIIGAASAVIGVILPKIGAIILLFVYPLTWYFSKVITLFS